jgi:hypothetical protein
VVVVDSGFLTSVGHTEPSEALRQQYQDSRKPDTNTFGCMSLKQRERDSQGHGTTSMFKIGVQGETLHADLATS